jgi:nucleoside-diphosphate-sugar epimerase
VSSRIAPLLCLLGYLCIILPATVSAEPHADGVLIFGGTRNTGLEVARLLRSRDESVTVFVRRNSDRSALEPLGVRFVTGDALNAEEVRAAFDGRDYRAVVTTLGCFKCEHPPDFDGNRNVFDAARDAQVPRVIMISSIGAGSSAEAPPWISNWFLKDVLALKTRAEDFLQGTGLSYTIIRPGGLKNGEPTGHGILDEDPMSMGIITRRDLAGLVVDALDDPDAGRKIYSAMDTELEWPWDMWD